jgi:hypothetical protein
LDSINLIGYGKVKFNYPKGIQKRHKFNGFSGFYVKLQYVWSKLYELLRRFRSLLFICQACVQQAAEISAFLEAINI